MPNDQSFSKKSAHSNAIVSDIAAVALKIFEERKGADPWIAEPLPWWEFLHNDQHMGFPSLSAKQIEFWANATQENPKRTFDTAIKMYDVIVAACGKGSGKDQMAVMVALFYVYVLLHLRDPFGFVYGKGVPGEPIDILIVAPRGRTTKTVTFEKLRQRVKHWRWLRDKFPVRESGRQITGDDRTLDEQSVEIGSEAIIFPGNIRVFALNSSNESAEGFNILVFIATEFAAFVNSDDRPNADKIFDTLYSSANSRFPGKFLGILISYPRFKGDAMMQKYREAVANPAKRFFPIKASSWEFNPMLRKESYAAELNDPDPGKQQKARGMYLCEPGEKESRFVGLPERIRACVNKSRPPICTVEPFEESVNGMRMRRMRISSFNIPRQSDSKKYVARVDLGKVHDRAALCIGHRDGDRVIQDLLVHWVPDERTGLVVDIDDPANLILELNKKLIRIVYCSYDQWNSSSSVNRLNRAHIETEILSLGAKEYQTFLAGLYSKSYDLLDFPALVDEEKGELFHLVQDNVTGKVDHEEGWHNDLTEAACGVFAMLKGLKKNMADLDSGVSNIKPNLNDVSNDVWSDDVPGDPFMDDGDDGLFPGMGVNVHLR